MTQKIWKVFITLALVAVLLLIAAEFGLRWVISDQMKKDFAAQDSAATAEPKISFGPTPLLLSQITGVVPEVDVETPSTVQISEGPDGVPQVDGTPASTVSIDDLRIKDQSNPTAGHMVVNTELPEDFLLAQAQASLAAQTKKQQGGGLASQLISGLVKITKIDTLPNEKAVKVEFTDGAATLTLRPTVENGTLKFAAEDASLLGMNLPSQVTDTLTNAMEKQATELSGLLQVTDLQVEDTKISLRMEGNDVPLNELQGTGEPARPGN